MIRLAPSMERADWMNLEHEVRELEKAGVELLHVDIMDRTYGETILLSPNLVPMLKKTTRIPLDVHMYVSEPEAYFPLLFKTLDAADYINLEVEAPRSLHKLLTEIRVAGIRRAVTLEIATPLNCLDELLDDVDMVNLLIRSGGTPHEPLTPLVLDKISRVRKLFADRGREVDIEVDGSVTFEDAVSLKQHGANVFVLGTKVIFRKDHTYTDSCRKLRDLLQD
jgi:ribulose-phosphate 3-epimerase